MPRPPRLVYAGATYHVTTRGNNREPIFQDDTDRWAYLARLARVVREGSAVVLAFVLMPNHVHVVLQTREANLPALLHRLQGPYARFYNRRHGRRNHLFGQRYGSRPITTDAHLLESTRYIHRNPVRAGLVDRPQDYPWSSLSAYAAGQPSALVDPRPVLQMIHADPQRAATAYLEFVGADTVVAGTGPLAGPVPATAPSGASTPTRSSPAAWR
jgi:REP element-mobilizing transposase RayT